MTLPHPMTWLLQGVPLTSLIDLYGPQPPDSHALYREEPAPAPWPHGDWPEPRAPGREPAAV